MVSVKYPRISCSGGAQASREAFRLPGSLIQKVVDARRQVLQKTTIKHLEETHADTGKMCKLHTDSEPSQESNPGA